MPKAEHHDTGKNNEPAVTLGALPPSSMKHLRRDSVWQGNDLIFRRRTVASIALDLIWPGMWRVKIGDRLTGMANRVRARDAAMALGTGRHEANQEPAQRVKKI